MSDSIARLQIKSSWKFLGPSYGFLQLISRWWQYEACACVQLYITLISLAIFIIPAIIIAVCYTLIVIVIWRQSSSIMTTRVAGSNSRRHRRVTKTFSSTWGIQHTNHTELDMGTHFARSNTTQSTNLLTQSNSIHVKLFYRIVSYRIMIDVCVSTNMNIQSNPSYPLAAKKLSLATQKIFH